MEGPTSGVQPAVGVDVGATLAKIAVREPSGKLGFGFLPSRPLEAVARRIRALAPETVGLTGCGASALEEQLDRTPHRVVEFEAWARGSRELLRAQAIDPDEPYLLISLGTGTSVLRIEGEDVTRLGGTALGGGTVLGLGVALTGCGSYEELCELARKGRRGNVDLLVGDIYREGEIALPGELTAASFGSLARWLAHDEGPGVDPSRREDLAAAVMGLVGENVALITSGLAGAAGVRRLVFGGATLKANDALCNILLGVSAGMGREPVLLENGGFAGAVGALGIASAADAR